MFTKKKRKYLQLLFLFMMMTGLLATSCSPQGYRGGYHKKSRRCNCPSFSGNRTDSGTKQYLAESMTSAISIQDIDQ